MEWKARSGQRRLTTWRTQGHPEGLPVGRPSPTAPAACHTAAETTVSHLHTRHASGEKKQWCALLCLTCAVETTCVCDRDAKDAPTPAEPHHLTSTTLTSTARPQPPPRTSRMAKGEGAPGGTTC